MSKDYPLSRAVAHAAGHRRFAHMSSQTSHVHGLQDTWAAQEFIPSHEYCSSTCG